MESVAWAIEMLREADSVEEIQLILKSSARAGVDAQGVTVVWLDEGRYCHYADEDAMSPLWQGQRFPVDRCISGWAMMHGQTVAVPDIRDDDRIPQAAYRPTFVRSLVIVPIRAWSPIGAIGAYWADLHQATGEEIATLASLAEAADQALARIERSPAEPAAAADATSVA